MDWSTLSARQIAALNYKLQYPDATAADIAEYIGCSKAAVDKWSLPKLVKQVLLDRQQATNDLIDSLSIQAVVLLQSQLSHADGRVAGTAAKILLAYAIGQPQQKLKVDANVTGDTNLFDLTHLTYEQLMALKQPTS